MFFYIIHSGGVMKTVIKKLKELRRAKGYTQSEIAEKLGITQSTYSYWEAGKVKIDSGSLKQLSNILGVSTDYLLENSINTTQPENSITIFGYGGERKDFELTPEQAKMLEQLAQEMSKNKN